MTGEKTTKVLNVELLEYKIEQNYEIAKALRNDLNDHMSIMSDSISKMSQEMTVLATSLTDINKLKKDVNDFKTFSTEVSTLITLLKKYVFPTIGFIIVAGIGLIFYIITHSNFLTNFIGPISNA